jgi:hypothetical protein
MMQQTKGKYQIYPIGKGKWSTARSTSAETQRIPPTLNFSSFGAGRTGSDEILGKRKLSHRFRISSLAGCLRSSVWHQPCTDCAELGVAAFKATGPKELQQPSAQAVSGYSHRIAFFRTLPSSCAPSRRAGSFRPAFRFQQATH